ncbi:MAG: methyltransferase [Oscillospiraceae bacterium]|nr:methyltransferase [Oscillospiraceae bacterium]
MPKITSRERFLNAAAHKTVDRAVFDLYGCPQTMIMSSKTVEDIKKVLNISGEYLGPGYTDERILEKLHIDTRMTGGMPSPKNDALYKYIDYAGKYVGVDIWGIGYADVGGRWEIAKNPLKDMTLDEVKKFPFPKASDIDKNVFEQYRIRAKNLYENTDYAVVGEHPCFGIFEIGCWMFGFDDFLYRLAGEPETVHWFFEKILEYQKEVIKMYYGAIGEYIHCTTSGDDFGTQRGLFMSVNMFDEFVAPYMKERIRYTKTFTKAYYQHHTCGSVFRLIPSLIDCGVDILNPIQPNAFEMEPERLKSEYGKQMSFWGGIDTQDLLVNSSPKQVREEAERILSIFGTDGGYILSPAHCIQEDVPAENVVAIYM